MTRNRWKALAGAGVLAAGVAGVVLTNAWGTDKTPPVVEAKVFVVNGTVTVTADSLSSEQTMDGSCVTGNGYDDVRTGAQVTVRDDASKVVALGALTEGHVTEQFTEGALIGYAYKCTFKFAVTGVPEGHAIYSVEVSHRGELHYSRADLNPWLKLTIG